MPTLPESRLNPSWASLGVFSPSSEPCDACGEQRSLRYDAPLFDGSDALRICPWCVIDGRAARELHVRFNDPYELDGIGPDFDPVDPPVLAHPDAIEVVERTPSFGMRQGLPWRSHCGRACVVVGLLTEAQLHAWADEPAFLLDAGDATATPERLRSRPLDPSERGFAFACVVCGMHRLLWDVD